MTIITIELPDEIANQAAQAGILSPLAITRLIENALAGTQHDDSSFRRDVGASLVQADHVDAIWFTHAQIQMEWQAERSALLTGRPLNSA